MISKVALLAPLVLCSIGSGQVRPDGVRYKKAAPEINRDFEIMLTGMVKNKVPNSKLLNCYADAVICGPMLWEIVKKVPRAADSGKAMTFLIPQSKGEPARAEGRRYLTSDDRYDFANTVRAIIQLAPMKVRSATKAEIGYYWAIIPFDIEEPLFVAESKKITILFNGIGTKIFFVEALPKPR